MSEVTIKSPFHLSANDIVLEPTAGPAISRVPLRAYRVRAHPMVSCLSPRRTERPRGSGRALRGSVGWSVSEGGEMNRPIRIPSDGWSWHSSTDRVSWPGTADARGLPPIHRGIRRSGHRDQARAVGKGHFPGTTPRPCERCPSLEPLNPAAASPQRQQAPAVLVLRKALRSS